MGMRGEKPKLTKVFLYCPFFVVYLVTLTNVGSRSQRTRAFHLPPRAAAACPSAPWTPARALHWAGPPTLAPCCVVGNLSLYMGSPVGPSMLSTAASRRAAVSPGSPLSRCSNVKNNEFLIAFFKVFFINVSFYF
jgi:hypothetical protein